MAKRKLSKKRILKMMLEEALRQLTSEPSFDLRRTELPHYDRRRSAGGCTTHDH